MRRLIRITGIIVVLSVGVILVAQYLQANALNQTADQSSQSLVQDSVIADFGDLTVTVSGIGPITPTKQVSLMFQTSAPVSEILVQEGQAVKQGDVLARLDLSDLESALRDAELMLAGQQVDYAALTSPAREVDIAAAQAAVDAAKAQLAAASLGADTNQIEIARLQAELARNALWQAQLQRDLGPAQAQQAIDRAGELGIDTSAFPEIPAAADNITPQITQAEYGVGIADVTLERVENQPADVSALASANAQLVSAQVQLDRLVNGASEVELQLAGIQLQIAELAVDQARIALARGEMIAPFDGVVAQNNLIIGEVPSSEIAIQIVDVSSYYVDVSIDETDIVKLDLGQKVRLRLDALPDEQITGVVTRVAMTPSQVGQLVTYPVRVTLEPANVELRAGMTSTVTIVIDELENVLTLPNRFIRLDRTTQQAYVTIEQADGIFVEVPVELGVRNETESQILSGVDVGNKVVLLPRESLNIIG